MQESEGENTKWLLIQTYTVYVQGSSLDWIETLFLNFLTSK